MSDCKKVELIMPTHMCTYPEHLVKISPLHSEIIILQRDHQKLPEHIL